MGLLSRLSSIFKSNAHAALDRMENPESMLNQFLRNMQEEIGKAEAALVKQMTLEKMLKARLQEATEMSHKREQQAETALKAGDEGLAKRALEDKQTWDINVAELAPQVTQAMIQREQFSKQLVELKRKYEEMKTKRASLVARHQYATSMAQIQKTMNNLNGCGVVANFDRISERISQMEAEANARGELNTSLPDIDLDFKKLSGNSAVDLELQALKAKLKQAQ